MYFYFFSGLWDQVKHLQCHSDGWWWCWREWRKRWQGTSFTETSNFNSGSGDTENGMVSHSYTKTIKELQKDIFLCQSLVQAHHWLNRVNKWLCKQLCNPPFCHAVFDLITVIIHSSLLFSLLRSCRFCITKFLIIVDGNKNLLLLLQEKDLLNRFAEVSAENNQLLNQLGTTKNIMAMVGYHGIKINPAALLLLFHCVSVFLFSVFLH